MHSSRSTATVLTQSNSARLFWQLALFCSLPVFLGLVSCASKTLSPEQCANADWRRIGYIDGRLGAEISEIENHQSSCSSQVVSESSYRAGFEEGLRDYCTPRAAYFVGVRGERLKAVCGKDQADLLASHHEAGLKVYALKLERRRLKEQLERRKEEMSKDRSLAADVVRVANVVLGFSATATEERRIETLNAEISSRLQAAPPGPKELGSIEDRIIDQPLSVFQQAAAISTGTVFGFGMGHAIQGSYLQSGWKWTAIDAIHIASFISIANLCRADRVEASGPGSQVGVNRSTNQVSGLCSASLFALGLGFIVSRVWQGTELFGNARHEFSPYQIGFVPVDSGALATVSFKF